MYKNFEDYLAEVHGRQFVGTKETVIEDFEEWMEGLAAADWLDFGEKYVQERLKKYKIKC